MLAAYYHRLAHNVGIVLAFTIGLALCGCGLKDYETHIDEERANLQTFDDQNKVLTAPLEMPLKITGDKVKLQGDAFTFKFFLRPPLWIAPKILENEKPLMVGQRKAKEKNDKDAALAHEISVYRYPGSGRGFNLFYSEFLSDLDLKGQHTFNGLPPREFRLRVRMALEEFVQKTFNETVHWAAEDRLEKVPLVSKEKGQPLKMDFELQKLANMPAEGKDDPRYREFDVYFYHDGQFQAAVVFQLPGTATKDVEVKKTIDFSLQTLRFSQAAVDNTMEFSQRRKPRK